MMAQPPDHPDDPAYDYPGELVDEVGGWMNDASAPLGLFHWSSCGETDLFTPAATQSLPAGADLDFDIDTLIRQSGYLTAHTAWPAVTDPQLTSSQRSDPLLLQSDNSVASDDYSEAVFSASAWSITPTSWLNQPYIPGFPPQDESLLAIEHVPQSAYSQTSVTESRQSSTASYKCTHLGCKHDGFNTQSKLKHHMRCHTPYEKRPHVCGACQKRFIYIKDLNRHKLTHDKTPGSFICPSEGCEERFKRADHLSRHIKNAHSSASETTSERKSQCAALASSFQSPSL